MAGAPPLPAFELSTGSSEDLDSVMQVMETAFGKRFGEAWTRSQCAGILPMKGIDLVLARDSGSIDVIGFTLSRTVADEAELLLIAVAPEHHRRGIGRSRGHGGAFMPSATATRPSRCTARPVSPPLAGARITIAEVTAIGTTR